MNCKSMDRGVIVGMHVNELINTFAGIQTQAKRGVFLNVSREVAVQIVIERSKSREDPDETQ